jgi:hypothetical protein
VTTTQETMMQHVRPRHDGKDGRRPRRCWAAAVVATLVLLTGGASFAEPAHAAGIELHSSMQPTPHRPGHSQAPRLKRRRRAERVDKAARDAVHEIAKAFHAASSADNGGYGSRAAYLAAHPEVRH